DITTAFAEVNGELVMEAENYHSKIARGVHDWAMVAPEPPLHPLAPVSGVGAMQSQPEGGDGVLEEGGPIEDRAAEMIYRVQFESSGNYDLWVRCWANSVGSDSVYAGLDQVQLTKVTFGANNPTNDWRWIRKSLTVDTPGVHEFSLWMREDGFYADKIVINRTDVEPSGFGPSESAQVEVPGLVPNQPPAVALSAPDAGIVPVGTIRVAASASDPEGNLALVEFFANGVSIGGVASAPYEVNWTPSSGTYAITAVATDGGGASTTSSAVTVTVEDPVIEPVALDLSDFSVSGNDVTLTWASTPGVIYQVESSMDLVNWTPVTGGQVAGGADAATTTFTAVNGIDSAEAGTRYYRVRFSN
ncbi:MAG: Ig-like domain-containing protein, partial [Verrucomicrobiota bacterium]